MRSKQQAKRKRGSRRLSRDERDNAVGHTRTVDLNERVGDHLVDELGLDVGAGFEFIERHLALIVGEQLQCGGVGAGRREANHC